MVEADNTCGLKPLGSDEHDSLALACPKSRWLSLGQGPHANTPETQRFAFFNSESLDCLRKYFRSHPHRIREGVVYRNLAFVQQVDLGDEWLVLRRQFDDESGESYWVPFESYSLSRVSESAARFECAIQALEESDPFDTAVLLGNKTTPTRQRRNR